MEIENSVSNDVLSRFVILLMFSIAAYPVWCLPELTTKFLP